ncbi:hypothetical protein FHQ18_06240 [Deferribacter autotrophicus]|uniref:Uncharacterized protein n=1 Tax=Deferribacter autotrophicus TaxID=500465 RepID=A0A5A8F3P0_9BACT|nr:hypothetical protein [Deferribacter autotrophicus]KAA0257989.1 hypothetical protein FHQ18_06240 [Deferribacter autotrophicus]
MSIYYKLHEYFIEKINENEFKWYQPVDELIFKGNAFVFSKINSIILSSYEDILESTDIKLSDLSWWNKTKYYAILSDSGNITFYYVKNNLKVTGNEEEYLRKNLGCTSKFR